MVAQVHGLGALQVRVAGHLPVEVLRGALDEHGHQRGDRTLDLGCALARVHRQVGHHLVVARARRVQPAADRSDDLRQAPLDRHVDVFVVGLEREALVAQLGRHRVEAGEQGVAVLSGDDAALGEHPRVCA